MNKDATMSQIGRRILIAAVMLSGSALYPATQPAQPSCSDANTRCDFLEDAQPLQLPTKAVSSYINFNDGSIQPELVGTLLTNLLENGGAYATRNFPGLMGQASKVNTELLLKKSAVVIHVVLWTAMPGSGDPTSATPDQRWYIFENGRLRTDLRMFGAKRFWFVYIHLNRGDATYVTRYDFQVTQATPQNLQNLGLLASIPFTKPQTQEVRDAHTGSNNDIWGGKELNFPFSTSDIKISPTIKAEGGSPAIPPNGQTVSKLAAPAIAPAPPAAIRIDARALGAMRLSQQPVASNSEPLLGKLATVKLVNAAFTTAPAVSNSTALDASAAAPAAPDPPATTAATTTNGVLGASTTFHNEAAEWWDVSVGFPVTNVNQLSFNQSSTSGAFTPSQVDSKKLLGLLDLYLLPKQRYQIAESGFSWIPSLIVGLPFAGQPLHKPVAALGWGPPLVQFYIGAVVSEQPSLAAGAISTKSVCTGWCPQFTFGINFGVKAITSKLSSKSGQ